MKNTKNYNLQKPDFNNVADIQILNDNFDKIDNGITPFYVATLESTNTYKITTGINKTSLSDGYSIRVAIPSDSNGATSIKVDNVTVPVKKPNGNPVSNFKQNGVYSLTYYNSVFILASGSDESDSTSVGTDGSKVLAPETFIGSDGEIHTGTIPIQNSVNSNLNCGQSISLPAGYYGAESKITGNSLASQTPSNADASKIVSGYHAWINGQDVWGNATIQSLGGKNFRTGTIPASQVNLINKIYALIDISSDVDFTPIAVWGMCGNYYFSICNINGQIKYINYYNKSSDSEYRTNMSSIYGQTLNVKQIPVNSGANGSGSGNSAKQYDTIWYAIG